MRIKIVPVTLLLLINSFIAAPRICAEPNDHRFAPITENRIIGIHIDGPPTRPYEPLMIGDGFGRNRVHQIYSFFPELASLDSAQGIQPVDNAKQNRIVLQLRSKVNGRSDFELYVLEGNATWTCGGKYFSMKTGWAELLAKEFARQEKDRSEQGYPKVLHIDKDNAASVGFSIKIANGLNDEYNRVSVTMKPELAASFQHTVLTYYPDGELLLSGTAHLKNLENGQLEFVFNVAPKIAKDIRFAVQIASKPRPLVYRLELQSFLDSDSESK